MSKFRRATMIWLTAIVGLCAMGWIWTAVQFAPRPASSMHETASITPTETSWPQLRGPTHDAISLETGLAESWPEVGPPVVWTRELGQGYSSFVAVGNRVFTQCQSIYRQSVVCLDAETGETVWSYQYGWPYDGGGLYPGPRSTPTCSDGRVYFAAPDGMIGCLSAKDGQLIWSCNPKKTHHGRGTDFGYASSPVVVDGRVIVPVGGLDHASVVALDARDGSTIWTAGESSASYASPLPIRCRGRTLAIVPLENSLAAFDLVAGKHLWEVEFSQGYDEHSAAPLYQEPLLVIASPFRAGAKCFRLNDNEEDSQAPADHDEHQLDQSKAPVTENVAPVVAWENPKFSNDVSSSVLIGDRIYGFDLKDVQSRLDRPSRGEFRCLDLQTGRIIWSTNKVGQASVIAADQKLILFTDNGELILARFGTEEYTELARTQVFRDEICWTSHALHRGCVYMRTQSRAACVYVGATPFTSRRPPQLVADIPRGHILNAKTLIGGEREFPATVPEWHEFRTWYLWSLGGALFASTIALSSFALAQRFVSGLRGTDSASLPPAPVDLQSNATASQVSRCLYWLAIVVAGVMGSPWINWWQSDYVLLWPLALWAIFQMTVNAITVTERQAVPRRWRWLSRGCGLLFIATCFLYFSLCRSLGYAIEWSFLVGFLPAFAVAAVAARFLTTRPRFWPLTDLLFSTLSFTAYFWFSVIFIKWKLVIGS